MDPSPASTVSSAILIPLFALASSSLSSGPGAPRAERGRSFSSARAPCLLGALADVALARQIVVVRSAVPLLASDSSSSPRPPPRLADDDRRILLRATMTR